jgi:hypothetical protein
MTSPRESWKGETEGTHETWSSSPIDSRPETCKWGSNEIKRNLKIKRFRRRTQNCRVCKVERSEGAITKR